VTRLARAFVALVPPGDVLDALAARLEPVAAEERRLRWLPRQQWHLTLEFLGPVGDAEALVDALGPAVAGVPPFAVRLHGGGGFPSPGRATVLWLGVEEPAPVAALAAAVGRATAGLGPRAEDRAFHPHLTVARAPRPCSVAPLVETLADEVVGRAWTAERVALEVSDTRPSGAVHTVWAELPLGP
jgi:2'-5' RNA ligase